MSPAHLLSFWLNLILLHTLSFLPPLLLYASLSLILAHPLVCPYHFHFLQLFSFTPLHSLPLFLLLVFLFFLWSLSWSLVHSFSPAVSIKVLQNGVQPFLWRDEKGNEREYCIRQLKYILRNVCLQYIKNVNKPPRLLLSKLDNAW